MITPYTTGNAKQGLIDNLGQNKMEQKCPLSPKSRMKVHGSGLMVYIRSDFCFKVVNDLPNLALSEWAGYRTQSIVFKVKIGKNWETFVGIYRPPTSIKVPKTVSPVAKPHILTIPCTSVHTMFFCILL